ncbi:hypothetical protein NUM3379_38180 [Kineococcus sp. NUM-3379]
MLVVEAVHRRFGARTALDGVSLTVPRRRTAELLERLGLAQRAREPLESLSLGNQQRVQIAAALVHDPELLVLDEPFSGLDPLAVQAVAELLRERAAAGVGVLFSRHQLDLVERLCDELVVLRAGRVVAAGEPGVLRRAGGAARHVLEVDGDLGWLARVPGVRVVEVSGGRAVFEPAAPHVAQDVLAGALRRGPVRAFAPLLPTLGELFAEVAG